jgi:ferredoxin-NADP reductase
MKFTLIATKQEANDTFSFIFALEQQLDWKPGQLLRYVLNHSNLEDRGVELFFSIASAPHEKHVMLTTRFASKSSSFKRALKNLALGDAIEAHDLEGDFVMDDSEKTFVFIAGGIGITPFRAILRSKITPFSNRSPDYFIGHPNQRDNQAELCQLKEFYLSCE